MDKTGGTISLLIALFLLAGMLMHLDALTILSMAVVALIVLAVYQFWPRVPRS